MTLTTLTKMIYVSDRIRLPLYSGEEEFGYFVGKDSGDRIFIHNGITASRGGSGIVQEKNEKLRSLLNELLTTCPETVVIPYHTHPLEEFSPGDLRQLREDYRGGVRIAGLGTPTDFRFVEIATLREIPYQSILYNDKLTPLLMRRSRAVNRFLIKNL